MRDENQRKYLNDPQYHKFVQRLVQMRRMYTSSELRWAVHQACRVAEQLQIHVQAMGESERRY